MTDPSTPQGFFAGISASEAGQLLSLSANCLQVVGFALQIYDQVEGDQDVLDAITALSQKLDQDFAQLGNLIEQQIQLVLQNENAIALAQALSHSGAAMDHLITWMRTKGPSDLAAADNESDLGIQFFLALPANGSDPGQASQTQPYFLPGIAKAGTIRLLVLQARDGTHLWTVGPDVSEMQQIIALMDGMLSFVEATVNAAHSTVWENEPGIADPVILGYMHEEHSHNLQFFSAGPPATNAASFATLPKRVSAARAAADAARTAGVTAELSYMGIPGYQTLVDGSWKAAITNPLTGVHLPIGDHPVEVASGRK
jgi:hypothetical protein